MFTLPLLDDLGPEAAALRLARRPGLAWLDGGPGFGDAGRWSFVGSDPVQVVSAAPDAAEPLSALHALQVPAQRPVQAAAPVGAPAPERVPCWIGSLSYDALSALGGPRHSAPLWFARYDALLAYDHLHGRGFVVGDDADACERFVARLAASPGEPPRARVHELRQPDPASHLAAVAQALEHIRRGDIYQVNLARRWSAAFAGEPLALFLAMRRESPVPLGFYQAQGERSLSARTMECFLDWRGPGGALQSRPIKGTRARADGELLQEAQRLRDDPKEQAEHTMIIDLMRNDLGRVAALGSVEVAERLQVEPYAGLCHLVSTVRCRSRAGLTLAELVEATFPPGSVTGTPKRRAMQILETLEPVGRGPYTGAVGHVDRSGGASLAVAIRTAVVQGPELSYWAGGGIVADSVPERELAETELKARVFLDALAALESAELLSSQANLG
jgi:anthranilate/para-aminobenzoate synthase component I